MTMQVQFDANHLYNNLVETISEMDAFHPVYLVSIKPRSRVDC